MCCSSIEKLHQYHHWDKELAQTMKESLIVCIIFWFSFCIEQVYEREGNCSQDDSDCIYDWDRVSSKMECINYGFSCRKVSEGLKTNT